MGLIGTPDEKSIAKAWEAAMKDILSVSNQSKIPELNWNLCNVFFR